jgi:hypothetical protein
MGPAQGEFRWIETPRATKMPVFLMGRLILYQFGGNEIK